MRVHRRFAFLVLASLAVAACSGSTGQEVGTAFTSPQPPDEWASGLTIGFIPDGYSWVWNEGHETATFHVFQTEDESGQLSIGVQISPPPHPGSGEALTRDGRHFVVYDEGTQIRVTEDVGDDTRVDVVSGSLDRKTLLQIAESITYEPVLPTTEKAPPGGLLVPECDDVNGAAACAEGFVLDNGVFYALDCAAIDESAVTHHVLGAGEFEGESVTVNEIADVDRSLMVAVSLPGGLCTGGPNEQPLSAWTMAFPMGADNEALLQAVCSVGVLTDAQKDANGC
ncbi:MAG TPA: hypothetical protein VE569_10105 [Acidimicrobiia bacterium]|nr:hypothetical protein [Acidimicrobiia bacterium]